MAGARDPENYYGILKLKPGADEAAIKAAYRKRVKDLHPDTNRNPRAVEQFHKLQQAYEVLTDAKKRAVLCHFLATRPFWPFPGRLRA